MRNAGDAGYIRNITGKELAVCGGADSFLQSAMWGVFKSRFGWVSRAFLVDWAGAGERSLLVLFRRFARGLSMAYVPWGPELPAGFSPAEGRQTRVLAGLAQKLREFLPRDTAFIRFDPPWYCEEGTGGIAPPPGPPLKRAAADIQPPDTVLLDLKPSPREMLAAMKAKWRYNIGLAEKRGVTVSRPGDISGLEVFYRLLTATARRDGIAVHSLAYYRSLFEVCRDAAGDRPAPEPRVYTAEHDGDPLAAAVVLCRGTQATYLYGASADIKRNLMAPYALQWQAIQDAKASGCETYDLFGIPPAGDPSHPMAGLYRFKTGFGGTIIHRSGSWDYPYKPLLRAFFNTAEDLRKKARDRRKKTPVSAARKLQFPKKSIEYPDKP
ncbi:MAG: peptidoglycan bridge formation glycyltransferase FemA/FemB family protein [Treponema sp.]|jgi:lipid II:glycine glycyltransferase (peptidoglycan interpeptide bridge formation enzyme)|nr:peptidoglycan bridge formation glycyltransferase FemA/FemB family protein [Treponema sp.]